MVAVDSVRCKQITKNYNGEFLFAYFESYGEGKDGQYLKKGIIIE